MELAKLLLPLVVGQSRPRPRLPAQETFTIVALGLGTLNLVIGSTSGDRASPLCHQPDGTTEVTTTLSDA